MDVAAARPRVPSFYALELPRAIHGSLPEIHAFEREARDAAPARLNRPGPHTLGAAIDDAEYDLVAIEAARQRKGSARHLMDANAHLARSLRGRYSRWHSTWREADGLICTNPDTLHVLSGHRLAVRPWSPSSLERLAVCPYQFALRGILRLEPREESVPIERLDPLTRGLIFHQIQFLLLTQLKEEGLLPLVPEGFAAILKKADAVVERVAAEYEDQLHPAIPRVWQSEKEDLRTDVRGWLQAVAQNDTDWQPIHFEFGFGLRDRHQHDAASARDVVVLQGGTRLRGSIDLIEQSPRGTLRVTDHKTGKFPERVPLWTGGGRHLQPLLYAMAAESILGSPVEYGRLFYATQRGEFKALAVPLTPQARFAIEQFLAKVDGFVEGGFLPPHPDADACKLCDYRAVCGPREEERIQRKHKDDPRIEPLYEIRGMA